ncbi:MAG: DUF2075 domain-containing protein [Thermomicrobiales bacterium]|nr:DUF2075 domain-containing protein [Thermomicrobiales bacterium]
MLKRNRYYYSENVGLFLCEDENAILGKLVSASEFDVELDQREAWRYSVSLLKSVLAQRSEGHVLLEYTIPRMGKRIDAVLLLDGSVFVVEMKVGASSFDRGAIDQVYDYALDLKYFHEASADRPIIPILVATRATTHREARVDFAGDLVASPILADVKQFQYLIQQAPQRDLTPIEPEKWIRSPYRPTPTIIEAAQALFRDHDVAEISRTDAAAENLSQTANAIARIIENAKENGEKSICLVTGVPGSGKTLAGLVIANERHSFEQDLAVFLSGNGPLVLVLQEALARDHAGRTGITKSAALRKSKAFIQNIHHFRDDALFTDDPPVERVTVFDEAQRAWDSKQLAKFMREKKGVSGFQDSEPEFLIGVMDRHEDWAVIVCLIGTGQEINTGEAGLDAWISALETRFQSWHLHLSPQASLMIVEPDKAETEVLGVRSHIDPSLHLRVSLRSFRSERLSDFVAFLLSHEIDSAKEVLTELLTAYPIVLTRDRERAKEWLSKHARGSERFGQIASSRAYRLRARGVWVQVKPNPVHWFLNDATDVRSSNALEEAASEYDIQGLELDWTLVCWDADLRYVDGAFRHYAFRGDKWTRVNQASTQMYLTNAYRVLLTRARQGMILYVPEGDESDSTRHASIYDGTFNYLESLGIPVI